VIIHAHILSWNEEKILPFTLDYYSAFCEKIFVYDNMSTDSSDSIYLNYPNVIVYKWDSDNTIDDLKYIEIKSNEYKKSRDLGADWVIVCDCDEILYHPNLLDKLSEFKNQGIDMPLIQGHDMVSEEFPKYDGRLITEIIKEGSDVYEPMCKNIIFNPKKEVNYGFGAHNNKCLDCIKSETPELKLLHYKFLSLNYVLDRYRTLNDRLSDFNKKNKLGSHYTDTNAITYHKDLIENKIKIIK